jgi:hypothetical protein
MSAYKALVAEVTEYLARPGILKDGLDPDRYAASVVSETEIRDGELSFEIPGRDTVSGNPNSVSFDATAYAAELDAETEK